MPENEKQVVAPFNKKDIEEISVESVKKAIGDGDIQLPPGGTKLYKHTLLIKESSESSNTVTINVISTNQNAITTYQKLYELLKGSDVISIYGNNKGSVFGNVVQTGSSIETNHALALATIQFSAQGQASFDDMLSTWTSKLTFVFTDTVTEL